MYNPYTRAIVCSMFEHVFVHFIQFVFRKSVIIISSYAQNAVHANTSEQTHTHTQLYSYLFVSQPGERGKWKI